MKDTEARHWVIGGQACIPPATPRSVAHNRLLESKRPSQALLHEDKPAWPA